MRLFTTTLATVVLVTSSPLSAEGLFDWLPAKETIAPYCDAKLADVLGAAAFATTAIAAAGSSITTVTATPAIALVAGESSLMIVSGAVVTVVNVPVVSATAAAAAVTVSVAYIGGEVTCALSNFFDAKLITNEPIPLVMYFEAFEFGASRGESLESGASRFVKTEETIPTGTRVFSLGPLSEAEAAFYPNYNGRGLIKLGRFFDHVYESDIPEEERGFAVVPANSLNPIFIDKYTHIFEEDTLVEGRGSRVVLPSGTPFQLLRVRDDGWAAFELTDGFNLWVDNFTDVQTIEIDDLLSLTPE
jgi:hypothetical protein